MHSNKRNRRPKPIHAAILAQLGLSRGCILCKNKRVLFLKSTLLNRQSVFSNRRRTSQYSDRRSSELAHPSSSSMPSAAGLSMRMRSKGTAGHQ